MIRFIRQAGRIAVILLWLGLVACGTGAGGRQTLLLISVDGLRWDARQLAHTPNLDSLAAKGVQAEALIPVFPTKTFPNHYSIVTGLYPENHGIISNTMYDPVMDDTFALSIKEAVTDSRWWGGEPIWVTAEKQGLTAATLFWPGSEAVIKGVRPTYWKPYDHDMPHVDRVDQILSWLDLAVEGRPDFLTLYFHIVDTQSHYYGPKGDGTIAAIQKVDSTIGLLLTGLGQRGLSQTINIMIVSDHGMAAIDTSRVIFLDDFVDPEIANVIDWSVVTGMRPNERNVDFVYDALSNAHPRMSVYRRDEIPARLHYSAHHRIPTIIAMAEEGWSITTRDNYSRQPTRFIGGAHGYDNRYRSMGGVFIAYGPAFGSGKTLPAFSSVNLYNLMSVVLQLKPASNDGDFTIVKGALAR
ncbi:MAG: alkaline phosphatase family protein [Candidatus Marinimicrobia bacterium]|nr:alkaline phosphatase family protein [Candidatus Neomarinimicrobiota bacterium]